MEKMTTSFPGLDRPLAIVDIETTGGSVTRDRITEIGIVEVTDDGVREWSTLINPQMAIPRTIQALTGINDDMVADAPLFEQVAKDIVTRLEGKIFVAHNVRFDYGFIRNIFGELGYPLNLDLLCTVKLSRALYPEHKRHSLETLITRFGIEAQARHRALDDARATYHFMCKALADKSPEAFMAAVQSQTRRPSLPPAIAPNILDELPNAPGVYYFYGEKDALLYVGKSVNIRKRVMSHFTADRASDKEMAMCQQVREIRTQVTTGELSALLLESQEVKQKQPIYNRRLRRLSTLYTIQLHEGSNGLLSPHAVAVQDAERQLKMYGLFPSAQKARNALTEPAKTFGLCDHVVLASGKAKATQLHSDATEGKESAPCMGRQLNRCRGLCTGDINVLQHNVFLMDALAKLALQTWPFDGPIALVESTAPTQAEQCHTLFIIDNWCLLSQQQINGALSEGEIKRLALSQPESPPVLDRDIYRYLVKVVLQGSKNIKLVEL